jgi:outer membrane protein OmpA-like peptidoglycan-associated protein/tetratricopeptide (TPR) repeat protein
MKKRILYLFILLAGSHTLTMAQSASSRRAEIYFRNAEKEYNDQRYMYAIPFYRTTLKRPGGNDSLATIHIAESYWYVKNYDSALIYYLKYENKYGTSFTTSQRIAELTANHKQYAVATDLYKKLIKQSPSRNAAMLAERLKGFSNTIPLLRDSLDYSVRLLNLNTKQQDFSPQFFQQGLVFVSNRYSKLSSEKEFGWDGFPFSSIFLVKDTADLYTTDTVPGYSSRAYNVSIKANDDYTATTSNDNDIIVVSGMRSGYNGTIHRLVKFSDELNTKYNYGPLCFNKSGDKVYFTRNNLKPNKGRYNLEICMATLEKGIWGNIKIMPFVQPEFDFYHPALSSDETRLYFCSNMPGGLGGSDIYYVSLAGDDEMKTPINLDSRVNSAGNELFPTIHGDTLYFSSDGFYGLGGLDMYKTYMEKGRWKTPVNLGYPLNSSFDDFGVIFNASKKKGFFSSNRLGTDDIYVFENAPFAVEMKGTVLSRATLRRLDSAKVVIRSDDADETVLDPDVTDITGNYHFPVRPGRGYTLLFTRNGYIQDSMRVSNTGVEKVLALQDMLLTPIVPPPPPVVVDKDRDGDGVPDAKDKCPDIKGPKSNDGCPDIQARINELAKMVFFKTASAELSPAALKPLNEVADIIKDYPNVTLYIEGHTDSRAPAAYNMDLSIRRAASVKDFFVKRGFAASRFSSAGFGLTRPIADNNTEEGRALNRRVSIKATFH